MANLNWNEPVRFNKASELVSNDAAASITISVLDKKVQNMAILIDNAQNYIFTGVIASGLLGAPAKTFTVAGNKKAIIQIEPALYASSAGVITIACSIATGGTLGTSKVYPIELSNY